MAEKNIMRGRMIVRCDEFDVVSLDDDGRRKKCSARERCILNEVVNIEREKTKELGNS